MSRGPICSESNRPLLPTRGPTGQNDAGDPNCSSYLVQARGVLGSGLSVFTAALPGGAAVHLVISWVSRNVDEKDMAAIKRIVRYVIDHPDAAFNNMKALGGAAFAQLNSGVSAGDVQKLGVRTGAAGNPLLIGVTAAGMVWGFLKSIYESIAGVIDIIGDLEGFIDDSLQLMEALLSSEGEEACREIGAEVGRSSATRLREIAAENYLSAAFHMGELVGPVVVGIVLAYFTAGAGTAAMTSSRFTQLLAKLRSIPKASKTLERLSKRMRPKQRGDTIHVKLSPKDYEAALTHVFPSHYLDNVSRTLDGIAHKAAQRTVNNPKFVEAVERGNWKLAGTYFHSAAKQEIDALGPSALPPGWRIAGEEWIQKGKGGSRADVLLFGPGDEIVEIDWKTTGTSALHSVDQMDRHAGQIRVSANPKIQGTLTTQQSRSWVDYVRELMPNASWR